MKLTSAATLLYLQSTFDEEVAPTEWIWSTGEVEANEALNEHFCSQLDCARPNIHGTWKSERGVRIPLSAHVGGWIPRYFPDDSTDISLLLAKHEYITNVHISAFNAAADIVKAAGEKLDPSSSERVLSEGQHIIFSLAQYRNIDSWLTTQCPHFAVDLKLRREVLLDWCTGCFPATVDAVATLISIGQVLWLVPRELESDLQDKLFGR